MPGQIGGYARAAIGSLLELDTFPDPAKSFPVTRENGPETGSSLTAAIAKSMKIRPFYELRKVARIVIGLRRDTLWGWFFGRIHC